jgi:hypothetical protein
MPNWKRSARTATPSTSRRAGRRKLVKQGGLPLDYAREAAEEAGYLRGDHNGTSTVNDLLDAIDAEMRGQKRYPARVRGHRRQARSCRAISEREQHELDRHMQGLRTILRPPVTATSGPMSRRAPSS